MSSIRALTRPRRANSARAAATRASLALGSAGRGIWRGWMTGRSETVRVNERRVKNRQQVSDWQVINAGKVECFLTDARQLAARRQAPHLAGRLGEGRMGRGGVGVVGVPAGVRGKEVAAADVRSPGPGLQHRAGWCGPVHS